MKQMRRTRIERTEERIGVEGVEEEEEQAGRRTQKEIDSKRENT